MADNKLTLLVAAGVLGIGGAFWIGRVLTRPEPLAVDVERDAALPPVTLVEETPIPARWADAQPHVVPIVRARLGQEIARLVVEKKPLAELGPLPPHHDLGGGFWGELAYETKKQFIRIPAQQWARWNVSFESAWTDAVKALASRSETPLGRGGRALKIGQFGDDNDTARVLVPAVFEPLGTSSLVVAMPRASVLLVADPKDDTALDELAERVLTEHASGDADLHVFTWSAGKLSPFALPPSHRLAAKFLDLERTAYQAEVKAQTEALKTRLGDGEEAPYVASLFRVKNPTTNDEFTYVVHTEGVTTLLPRAEVVCFIRVDDATNRGTPQACASWDKVYARMKDRWTETPIHPARWLVKEFPTGEELRAFGFEKKP